MMTQETQKTDDRTDSRNGDSREKKNPVTTDWMWKHGLLQ